LVGADDRELDDPIVLGESPVVSTSITAKRAARGGSDVCGEAAGPVVLLRPMRRSSSPTGALSGQWSVIVQSSQKWLTSRPGSQEQGVALARERRGPSGASWRPRSGRRPRGTWPPKGKSAR